VLSDVDVGHIPVVAVTRPHGLAFWRRRRRGHHDTRLTTIRFDRRRRSAVDWPLAQCVNEP